MKKLVILLLSASLLLGVPYSIPAEEIEKPPIDIHAELKALPSQNWINLTQEQMLEDFDYLYHTLEQNYPYFGVAKRKYNINIDSLYTNYRKEVAQAQNDMEYWFAVTGFINQFRLVGHASPFDSQGYQNQINLWKTVEKSDPVFFTERASWLKVLDNPVSQKNYAAMAKLTKPLTDKLAAQNQSSSSTAHTQTESKNVTTKIIEEGKTAYININSFDYMAIEKDQKILFDFYKEVADYDNLIIDISNNGGGAMAYYHSLIVAPNIDKPYSSNNYTMIMDGENNRKFLDLDKMQKDGDLSPISKMPKLTYMNQEDFKQLDYYSQNTMTINPLKEGEKIFKGKLWVLISPSVYSSSESFANFCKSTGFATLVGTRTGGDGIGIDPMYVVLPNSGIIIRYSAIYGVTADGKNSEEFGTEPDYLSAENEAPLDTCLKVIKKGR